MATRLVDISNLDRENVFKRVRGEIEELFDSLIEKVNERREVLLRQLNQWEEEFNRTRTNCNQSLEGIRRERTEIEQLLATLKINTARTSMEKGIADLNEEIKKKEKEFTNPQVLFFCNRNDIELKILKLGLLSRETGIVMNYTELSKPVKVFGNFGKRKEEFNCPRGVLIDNANQNILIADRLNSRIQVWSIRGDYLSEFGEKILEQPWEIVLYDNFIYISDFNGNFLSKWCLNTFALVKKSNTSQGSAPNQLNCPTGLDIDEEEMFVVEYGNERISVFDLNLRFKRIMAKGSITNSFCLRVRNSTIYIVEETGVIKLFSTMGQLLKTIPKLPQFHNNIFHFNFDLQLNFLITIPFQNSLFILSPEGDLIHSFDFDRFKNVIKTPFSVSSFQDGRLLICFQANEFYSAAYKPSKPTSSRFSSEG